MDSRKYVRSPSSGTIHDLSDRSVSERPERTREGEPAGDIQREE